MAIMPRIIAFASKNGLFDRADNRKVHKGDVSRLGGIAVFTSFVTAIVCFAFVASSVMANLSHELRYLPVMAGMLAMFILGLIDDLKGLQAGTKLFFQLAAAALVVGSGFRFSIFYIPFGDGRIELGFFSWPLTLAWIIGVTNAMNLIDGLDGLLGGITTIASATFGLFFLAKSDTSSAIICFSLCGSAIGFLFYNKPKARIFMGDSGSLFIGFTLAVLPLLDQSESSSVIGLLPAIVVLGIPILDTLAAIWRRTKEGVHFFTPDRGHLHHMFLALGFTGWEILGIIYSICIALAACALSSLVLAERMSFILEIAGLVTLLLMYVFLRVKTVALRAAETRKSIIFSAKD